MSSITRSRGTSDQKEDSKVATTVGAMDGEGSLEDIRKTGGPRRVD